MDNPFRCCCYVTIFYFWQESEFVFFVLGSEVKCDHIVDALKRKNFAPMWRRFRLVDDIIMAIFVFADLLSWS